MPSLTLVPIDEDLTVCKVEDYSRTDLDAPYTFTGRTADERSLVCPTRLVPPNTTERDDGWRGFRIEGTLDFSLIGILSAISGVLADARIGIFALSTYDTDYVLTKAENFDRALEALRLAGYDIR